MRSFLTELAGGSIWTTSNEKVSKDRGEAKQRPMPALPESEPRHDGRKMHDFKLQTVSATPASFSRRRTVGVNSSSRSCERSLSDAVSRRPNSRSSRWDRSGLGMVSATRSPAKGQARRRRVRGAAQPLAAPVFATRFGTDRRGALVPLRAGAIPDVQKIQHRSAVTTAKAHVRVSVDSMLGGGRQAPVPDCPRVTIRR